MAEDRIWPDDYTYGFGGPAPKPEAPKFKNLFKHVPPPQPATITHESLIRFEARRWCIEQVVATRANAPSVRPIHEDAAALYDFLFEIPA